MVCSTYLQLLEFGEPGETYNVCSGQPYTLQFVIDALASLTGHSMQIEINPSFVRTNEVHRLCGSPQKLQKLLARHNCEQVNQPLESTLRIMLGLAINPSDKTSKKNL
jgi:UDP-glucose 4-epimerase